MRKQLSLLVLLVLAAAGSAHAYDFSAVTSSGHTLYYNIVPGGVEVTYPNDNNSSWDWYSMPIGALVIDSIVTNNDITFSVISIKYHAFLGCSGLTSISIPNSITSIGDKAFGNCSALTSVFFNATNCTYAGSKNEGVFSISPITSISFGNNVQTIPANLLFWCSGLTSIIIPNSVTSIGDYAFYGCTGLTSITIPNSVTSIGNYAFSDCTGLNSVTIPNTNISIGDFVFTGCDGITTTLFSKTSFAHLPTSYSGNYSIPDETITICGGALSGCSELVSVSIPNSVVDIRIDAFKNCTKLASISFPDGVTNIGNNAFTGCLRLTSVRLGEGVINIGSQAFKDCGIIGELVIPQSVTTIGNDGFRNCYGINEITCLGRVAPSLGDNVFEGLDTSITVNIPCGTTNLYAGRWSYFHNFNEIPFLFNVASDNLAYGTVQMLQEPSCEDPVAIVQATARNGYHFDHWSDGSTQNPYTCVVTGSMTLTAYFASNNGQSGIEDVDGCPSVYTDRNGIVVTNAEGDNICIYDIMGHLLVAGRGEGSSLRFDVPSAGIYIVRIGNKPAQKVVVIR